MWGVVNATEDRPYGELIELYFLFKLVWANFYGLPVFKILWECYYFLECKTMGRDNPLKSI